MAAKGVGIGVVVALVGIGAAYGVGRYQGNVLVKDAEARAAAAASGSTSAVALASVSADIERGKVARLEARRRLHLAMIALDEKNFGIANDHVAAARAHLLAAEGSDNELGKLAGELEQMKIVAADDVTEPRNKLLAWIKRIDELMPPAKP